MWPGLVTEIIPSEPGRTAFFYEETKYFIRIRLKAVLTCHDDGAFVWEQQKDSEGRFHQYLTQWRLMKANIGDRGSSKAVEGLPQSEIGMAPETYILEETCTSAYGRLNNWLFRFNTDLDYNTKALTKVLDWFAESGKCERIQLAGSERRAGKWGDLLSQSTIKC